MDRRTCLSSMKAPGDKRAAWCHAILQIVVTSRCELACSNCTYLVRYRPAEEITVTNFETAVRSLEGWPGIVGLIGGNPCLHPDFAVLCEILADAFPRHQRGLWTNNLRGHGRLVADVFGYLNLNVHGNLRAADEMWCDIPGAEVYGVDRASLHGAVMVSCADLVADEGERWAMIAQCDINQNWSAAIAQVGGKLGGYFCEVASTWAAVYGLDCGVAVVPGWWRKGIEAFGGQVDLCCHRCGVPLRLRGHYDYERTDDVSAAHLDLRDKLTERRAFNVVTTRADSVHEFTDYQRLRGET